MPSNVEYLSLGKPKLSFAERLTKKRFTSLIMAKWIYVWDSLCSEDATVDGVSFMGSQWKRVLGKTAQVRDPIYGQEFQFPIYEHAKDNGSVVRMAMREHTPGVYLAYVDDPGLAERVQPKSTREVKYW